MLSIRKDKTGYVNLTLTGDPDYYVITDGYIEEKILRGYPNIEFVLDENDNVIDVTYTVKLPLTLGEQIEKNKADIAYIAMMTDVEIEE